MRIGAVRGWLWSRVLAVCTVVAEELSVMMELRGIFVAPDDVRESQSGCVMERSVERRTLCEVSG